MYWEFGSCNFSWGHQRALLIISESVQQDWNIMKLLVNFLYFVLLVYTESWSNLGEPKGWEILIRVTFPHYCCCLAHCHESCGLHCCKWVLSTRHLIMCRNIWDPASPCPHLQLDQMLLAPSLLVGNVRLRLGWQLWSCSWRYPSPHMM